MIDFRLKVFDTVARRLNFTKAAEELCITQPAVTRHIKELERRMNLRLFERHGNRVMLSEGGRILLKHTQAMLDISRQLEDDLNMVNETQRGVLSLGASTTIAQYVLPPLLAQFHSIHKEVSLYMRNANTEQIEKALAERKIMLGIIEGDSKRRDINYTPFSRDEILLVCNPKHPLARREELRLDELPSIPMLLREPGSGTLEVILHGLKDAGLKLSDMTIGMYLGSSQSIKSYLLHSDECMAFISRYAVLRELEEGSLTALRVRKLAMHREFFFITPIGQSVGLVDLFMRFSIQHHKK